MPDSSATIGKLTFKKKLWMSATSKTNAKPSSMGKEFSSKMKRTSAESGSLADYSLGGLLGLGHR